MITVHGQSGSGPFFGRAGVTLSKLKTWHHELPKQASERTGDNAGRPVWW